jgi:hypothetical protein
MGRGVLVVALALLFALPAAASQHPVTRATTARDGTVVIGGKPQFLVGAGWPTPAVVPRALTLGIEFLQANGPGATQLAISRAVGTKGWILPDYTVRHVQAHYRNAIGYALPDEPDGNNLLPVTADPHRGPRVPYTLRAARTGKLIVQTITSHFMKERPRFDGIDDADYLGYIRNADVVLTAIYPFAHGCVDAGISLSMVYDAMVELKALAPDKAVGEWIETGPIEGYCGASPVTPEEARAEAWAAVAGGAQSLFWFTHTFLKGYWDDFDVSSEMGTAMATTNAELEKYSKIVLAHRDARVISDPGDPVKVGLRTIGPLRYLIAVNLSDTPADLGASSWWTALNALPGLSAQGVSELMTGWTGQVVGGRFADTIPGFGVRIYSWLSQQSIGGRGL